MKIETVKNASSLERSGNPPVETLEARLLAASLDLPDSQRPDPEFERLYQQLLGMEGRGEKDIYEFLRTLKGADGESRVYPNSEALLAVTHQVLIRLESEDLKDSLLFKEVSGANGLAFSLDLFVKSFMRDVFQPMEDDAWEKSEW